ncbi:MAG: hypothetical protein HUJ51_03045 [Eggerthellaceae bacterium]|nr:hypothetical protein [Eggerthellaceae bacterium]
MNIAAGCYVAIFSAYASDFEIKILAVWDTVCVYAALYIFGIFITLRAFEKPNHCINGVDMATINASAKFSVSKAAAAIPCLKAS